MLHRRAASRRRIRNPPGGFFFGPRRNNRPHVRTKRVTECVPHNLRLTLVHVTERWYIYIYVHGEYFHYKSFNGCLQWQKCFEHTWVRDATRSPAVASKCGWNIMGHARRRLKKGFELCAQTIEEHATIYSISCNAAHKPPIPPTYRCFCNANTFAKKKPTTFATVLCS